MATQPEKRENSVLFSLRELRQIEENRVQEEEHAVRSAEETRRMAQEAADLARQQAADAKVREERDAVLLIEQTRENAEREARMRVESAEATERQRQQAALEQSRLAHEMDLRRAEVAKKRPTWMLAVTGFCLVGVVVAVVLIVKSQSSEADAKEKEKTANVERDQAVKAAQEAQDLVDRLQRDLQEMDKKVNSAVESVMSAQGDADRASANAKLKALQKDKWEMEQRIQAAKAAADRAQRLKGVKVSPECQANPLAKGCM